MEFVLLFCITRTRLALTYNNIQMMVHPNYPLDPPVAFIGAILAAEQADMDSTRLAAQQALHDVLLNTGSATYYVNVRVFHCHSQTADHSCGNFFCSRTILTLKHR
jgi:hypothetical protein